MTSPDGYPYGIKSEQSGKVVAWFSTEIDRDICMDEVFRDWCPEIEWAVVNPADEVQR
jgi:hypothetical protein